MSEEKPEVKVGYDDFEAFHEKHPDLDNSEYYAEFPTVHKSTIRSWKVRARKEPEPEPRAPREKKDVDPYDEEMVKLLCTQTKTPYSDFAGVDPKTAILILKNKMNQIQADKPTTRPSNSGILPSPAPVGQNKSQYGIDDYIEFDLERNEIRIDVPLDEVMDPEKNKRIREISR